MALTLTAVAVFLFCLLLLVILVVIIRSGMGVRYVYPPPSQLAPPVIPGEVIEDADDVFFDEHDLAVAEAHEERPEFIRTQVLVNGIPAGSDGTVPDTEKRSWWRR